MNALRLGIDGSTPVSLTVTADDCRPPDICGIDACALACQFVHALPTGPLWDEAKRNALGRIACGDAVCNDVGCTSIVAYAVCAAHHLHMLLKGALWPAIRESSPATAHETLDDWLERLGWQQCITCACGCIDTDAGEALPPWQMIMPDGRTICCPDDAPVGLTQAVKKNLVIALWRLRLAPLATLDAVNFVIAPLRAALEPDIVATQDVCCRPMFRIVRTSDVLDNACVEPCPENGDGCEDVTAFWDLKCDGLGNGRRIYPGVIAAECIARAMLAGRACAIRR